MLLTVDRTGLAPATFVAKSGEVFAEFGSETQDSGNVSYGVRVGEQRFFVKTAGSDLDQRPALSHTERIALLRNAIRLNRTFSHPVLPVLRNVIESAEGPILVYDWVDGELLGVPQSRRSDPDSAFHRFRRLPVMQILPVLDSVFDLHRRLAAEGWIAVDFYDGCLIYDFENRALHVVDLDTYHSGPFVNRMGRMFGSTRFMAPEELELGAEIDERTNVFTLGRTVLELLSDGADSNVFRGPVELLDVAGRACQPTRGHRFGSVEDFCTAWTAARESGADSPT